MYVCDDCGKWLSYCELENHYCWYCDNIKAHCNAHGYDFTKELDMKMAAKKIRQQWSENKRKQKEYIEYMQRPKEKQLLLSEVTV